MMSFSDDLTTVVHLPLSFVRWFVVDSGKKSTWGRSNPTQHWSLRLRDRTLLQRNAPGQPKNCEFCGTLKK